MRRASVIMILLLAGCAGGMGTRGKPAEEADLFQVRDAAQASYAAKDYAQAEKHYTLLAQKVPVEPENWFRLGNIYARSNRPDLAIAAYREALVRAPDHAKAWYNLSILYLNTAASSLIELQKVAPPGDPMVDRSSEVLEELMQVLKGEAEKGTVEAGVPEQ